MRERYEGVESTGAYVDFNAAIFAWHCVLSDHPPALSWIMTWRGVGCRYMIRLV